VFDVLKRAFDGGRDELSRDNLVRWVVDRITALREYGKHGEHALPPEVEVTITVPDERVELVRGFVENVAFDREVGDELLNRLVGMSRDSLPPRIYVVEGGPSVVVAVVGKRGATALRMSIAGGDRDGALLVVPPGQRFVKLGRGAWHGPDQQERNDLIVSHNDPFVSRRAARMRRMGAVWEIESLDQGECLVVCRVDGGRIRPHHTPNGWVVMRPGDSIELNNGTSDVVIRVGLDVVSKDPGPTDSTE
jgi:hypothetical protein